MRFAFHIVVRGRRTSTVAVLVPPSPLRTRTADGPCATHCCMMSAAFLAVVRDTASSPAAAAAATAIPTASAAAPPPLTIGSTVVAHPNGACERERVSVARSSALPTRWARVARITRTGVTTPFVVRALLQLHRDELLTAVRRRPGRRQPGRRGTRGGGPRLALERRTHDRKPTLAGAAGAQALKARTQRSWRRVLIVRGRCGRVLLPLARAERHEEVEVRVHADGAKVARKGSGGGSRVEGGRPGRIEVYTARTS